MDVSIIIVNYNTFELTSKCIQSVIDKTIGLEYEIILVDNASHECDALLFKNKFPLIELIKSPINGGFAKGNNLGIAKAKGDFILLLNSDTELINNAVWEAWEVIKNDHTIGVLSGKLLYPNGQPQSVAGRFPSLISEIRELLRINKRLKPDQRGLYYLGGEFDYKSAIEADWVWGAFFLFPRSILKHFQGNKLSEDFFMYCEDIQWSWKIKKLGFKILFTPRPLAYHYISGSSQLDESEKSFKKTLPNLALLLKMEKGYLYKAAYFIIKALHLLSLRNGDFKKVIYYFQLALYNKTER